MFHSLSKKNVISFSIGASYLYTDVFLGKDVIAGAASFSGAFSYTRLLSRNRFFNIALSSNGSGSELIIWDHSESINRLETFFVPKIAVAFGKEMFRHNKFFIKGNIGGTFYVLYLNRGVFKDLAFSIHVGAGISFGMNINAKNTVTL